MSMYGSTSTQQPAAICALKSPADAIHVLEAVRVGLVPRVTRRLTGHERAQIRPGTVWVWEEEETNMRRWTDGRRWGASRVGGGGFLVYTESSESLSPPARSDSPNTYAYQNGFYPNSHREPLVKQTYSTSMTHPVTGKVKKFHVVGYSSKHNPQGDAHNPLPLPHQLPLLANLQVPPGIWPEWERRREGATTESTPTAKRGSAGNGTPGPGPGPGPVPVQPPAQQSPEIPTASGYDTGGYPSRAPSSAPPAYAPMPRLNAPTYNPSYYYSEPNSRSAPTYQAPLPPPHQVNDRYHPYRDRPLQYPSSAPSGVPGGALPQPNEGYDERRVSGSSSAPIPPAQASPVQSNGTAPQPPYPYGVPPSPYGAPYRDSFRREAEDPSRQPYQGQGQMMPPAHLPTTSPYPDQSNMMYPYQTQFPPHPTHQARTSPHPRPISHSPTQAIGTIDLPLNGNQPLTSRSPKNNLSSSTLTTENANSGGLTLPPLRVAIDDTNPRLSPGGRSVKLSPGHSPAVVPGGEDRRELGELGKKVSL